VTEQNTGVGWVFTGAGGRFASGVFASVEKADAWVARHKLTGTLTACPLDVGVWDWPVAAGKFVPKKPDHSGPAFVGSFSSAAQEHFHYEDGEKQGQERAWCVSNASGAPFELQDQSVGLRLHCMRGQGRRPHELRADFEAASRASSR
jgi:hypothetical protein